MADLKRSHPGIHADFAEEEIIMTPNGDWTIEEETQAKRKYVPCTQIEHAEINTSIFFRLDFLIMPILTLGFFCLRTVPSCRSPYFCSSNVP